MGAGVVTAWRDPPPFIAKNAIARTQHAPITPIIIAVGGLAPCGEGVRVVVTRACVTVVEPRCGVILEAEAAAGGTGMCADTLADGGFAG